MSIKRTWLKFRLASVSMAIDDCMKREARAQQCITKLLKRETALRAALALTPAPVHTGHIINMPEGV